MVSFLYWIVMRGELVVNLNKKTLCKKFNISALYFV